MATKTKSKSKTKTLKAVPVTNEQDVRALLDRVSAWGELTPEQKEKLADMQKLLDGGETKPSGPSLEEIRKRELRRWRIHRGKAVHMDSDAVVERLQGPFGDLGGWWQLRVDSRQLCVPVRTREEGMQIVDAMRSTVSA